MPDYELPVRKNRPLYPLMIGQTPSPPPPPPPSDFLLISGDNLLLNGDQVINTTI